MMQSLIEEAAQRATERLDSLLTLIHVQFEDSLARAHERAARTGTVVDPVATCCFEDARELLMRPEPELARALLALSMAAYREPLHYGPTYGVIHQLMLDGLQQAVDLEYERAQLGERDIANLDA
jgi:hypothetical protein